MGLDMYLERMPRFRNATATDVSTVTSYLNWLKARDEGKEYANCDFKEWSGGDIPKSDYLDFYATFYEEKYADWDTEKKYGYYQIMDEVGYWRKSNQIHNWFVQNVQDGIDDCDYHHEVTKKKLEELLEVCKRVLTSCELVDGQISDGYQYVDGVRTQIMTNGKYIKNPAIAEELLPARSGFFFGCTDYNEYYVEDLVNTMEIVQKVLDTTDFKTQMVYYVSSW